MTGTVTYRERIALTPEARVQVELRDVTGGVGFEDAPVVSRQIIDRPGQVPVSFEVPYALAAIAPGHAYAVSARITDRGQLQFVTDTPVPVIANAVRDSVEIVVVPVR